MTLVTVEPGDILAADADYLVNPANGFLRHGGGLAAMIERAAAPDPPPVDDAQNGVTRPDTLTAIKRWKLDHARAPLIATGNVYTTRPGLLPFRGVIHAVGPIWNGGDHLERLLLIRTMTSIMFEVERLGGGSVAVPAISCGVFGFPVEEAADILVTAARTVRADVDRVTFVPFGDAHAAAFDAALV